MNQFGSHLKSTAGRFSLALTAMGTLSIGLLNLGLLDMTATPAYAAPEPSPVNTQWEFTFESGPLRLHGSIPTPAHKPTSTSPTPSSTTGEASSSSHQMSTS